MLFTQKYAPKKLSEVLGNDEAKDKIRRWFLSFLKGEIKKPILLYGPPGIGKTAIAYALKHEYDLELIELNASELRNKDVVEKVLANSMLAGSLFGKKKILLIDDIDIIQKDDRGAVEALRKILENASVPIIATANDAWSRKLGRLRTYFTLIEMKKVSKVYIRRLLKKIISLENLKISDETLEDILSNADGDVRAALNDLEVGLPTFRERENNIFDIVRKILKGTNYESVKSLTKFSFDYSKVILWVDENIPYEYSDPFDLSRAFDALSRADIYLSYARKYNWILLKYAIDLMTVGVALSKRDRYHQFVRYKFPSYLRSMSATVEKRAKLKAIGRKLGEKLHTSSQEALSYLPFIKYLIKKKDLEPLIEFYRLTESEIKFIASLP